MNRFLSCAWNFADAVTGPRKGLEAFLVRNVRATHPIQNLFFTAFAIALALVASSDKVYAAETYHWKIGHVRPAGSHIDKETRRFVDKISKETEGNINITIYPSSKLGDYTVAQEKTSFGEVDMYIGPFGTLTDRRLLITNIPFLVNDYPEAKKVYSPDSFLMKTMAKLLEAQNIKILGGWPVYFGGIVLTEEPLSPTDPDISKNMIIRVPPIRSFELTARELGFTPYPITWVYAKEGLVTGMVKGMMGGGAEGYESLGKLARYYLVVNDHFEYWYIYMNLDLWNRLTEKEKSVIQGAAMEMESRRYEIVEAEELASIERLKKQGTKIIYFTGDELMAIVKKVRANVWPSLREDIGVVFDEVVSSVKDANANP